ncbi:MAG: hypothetical protein EXR93_03490 [Gemmatimonadetes bacterium]|nr:hypothetical protein [Gemmatimonadota bacterium]
MKRTFQTLAAFWPPIMLVTLLFSTMIDGTRTMIEHLEIIPYLIRWFVIISPAILFYFLAERSAPAAGSH